MVIPVLVFLFLLALVGVIALASHRHANQLVRHGQVLAEWAAKRGWTYSDLPDEYRPIFPPFAKGTPKTTQSTMTGVWRGRAVQAGVFQFGNDVFVTTNKDRPLYPFFLFSYCHIRLPGVRFPDLRIRYREGMELYTGISDNMLAADMADYPKDWPAEFGDWYHIYSRSSGFKRDFLAAPLREFLMARPGYCLLAGPDGVLVLRGKERWSLPEFEAAVEFGCDILDRVTPKCLEGGQRLFAVHEKQLAERLALEPTPEVKRADSVPEQPKIPIPGEEEWGEENLPPLDPPG